MENGKKTEPVNGKAIDNKALNSVTEVGKFDANKKPDLTGYLDDEKTVKIKYSRGVSSIVERITAEG